MRHLTQPLALALLTAVVTAVAGCPTTTPTPQPPTPPVVDADGLAAMAPSTKGALLWKRGPALARGLSEALLVPVSELCNELDRFSCVDFAHQVPLGGNDAFVKGQYEPQAAPSATTAVAFERVVVSACAQSVDNDRARPAAFIYRGHALDDTPLDPSSPDVVDGARFVATELFHRLHGREPREAELVTVADLLTDDDGRGVSGTDFAKLACFAIASTTETLFY